MVRKCMLIAGLVSLIVLGASLAGECETSSNETLARKWDFEDGKTSGWKGHYYKKEYRPTATITTQALNGKYSLNVKFDDKSHASHFGKGVAIYFKEGISWQEFNSISFRYLIEGEIRHIRIYLNEKIEGKGLNLVYYEDLSPVIGRPAEFRIRTDQLSFWHSTGTADYKTPAGKPFTGKVNSMTILLHNKWTANSGLKFSFTLDDIVLGKESTSLVSIMSSDVSRSPIAIAARTKKPISIDGKLNDWSGAVPVPLTRREQVIAQGDEEKWGGPANFSAVSMLLWDNKYLYFAVKARDDKVVCADPATNYDLCLNDSVRLCLRTNPSPVVEKDKPLGQDDYIFCATPFSPKGTSPVLVLANESYSGDPHKGFPLNSVQIASSYNTEGWIIEMAIPWKALKVTPAEDKPLGFFYVIVDDSDKPRSRNHEIIWYKTASERYYRDPGCWGELLLTKALTDTEAIMIAVKTGALSPTSDKSEYKRNKDVICSLDFWRPLSPTDITGKVINVKTEKIAGDSLSFSTRTTPLSTQLLAKWNTSVTEDGVYAVSCKFGKEKSVSVIGHHFKLIGLSVEKRREEIALAKINFKNLQSQLKRKDFHHPNSWMVDKPMEGRINRVHTERVDPAKWSLAKDPVTWEDMGGGFEGYVQVDKIPSSTLGGHFKHLDLGRCIKATAGGLMGDDWEEQCEDVKQRGLILKIYGAFGWRLGGTIIDAAKDKGIRTILGRNFLGYEVGEQDGFYIASIAPKYKPTSRKEAQKLFWDWTEENNNIPGYRYLVATSSLAYVHQYGAMDGYRMLGLETAQALPSDIMMWAFLRGAGKQYGLLTHNLISIFNRWSVVDDKGSILSSSYTSLSLRKRLYYVTYMYGSATNAFEGFHVSLELNKKAVKWCRKHNKDKSVQYTPIALLIDFTSGWLPPQQLYSSKRYRVWGNMDYERGDYQIDNFLRWIYPQYEECSYFKDERGFLTSTPFGDKFDVLTSNVNQRILDQYQAVCLLGELEMTPELVIKLKKFVKDGGDLIVSSAQAKILGADFCGVLVSDKMHRGHGGFSLSDKKAFEEKEYIYAEVTPKRAKVLAVSENKLPLITAADSGKGRVIVVTPDYWMSIRLKVDDGGDKVHSQRYELLKVQRYELLKTVRHVLGQYFKDIDFVEVDGSKIQYIVNLGKDNKRLVLTLVNNDREADWEGTVSLKEGKIVSAKEWMEEEELSAGRSIKVKVPKGDLRVIEIISDKPLFHPVNN